jgi:UDP-N-acetylglucosamine 2-epimerase (non-hydrolysing)
MMHVKENITVFDFENKENALIHMVFDGSEMIFPKDDLNLKEMMIVYDKQE